MKTVSVHIVTYNSAQDIEACLQAVLHQSYPVGEIIVVDNASRDWTLKVLEQYKDRVTIVCNPENNGFAGGHNQAFRLSKADYCLILNPDVTLSPDYLSELLQYAERQQSGPIGSLTGKLLLKSDPGIVDSCGLRMNKARRGFDLGAGERTELWSEAQHVFGVSGAAALYNRIMVDEISLEGEFFDSGFFAYKEDVDVAWRAQLFGWSAVFVPQAIAYHERGWKAGGRSKQPLFVRRLSYVNRYRMMLKNDQLPAVLRHLLSLLAYECASLGYVLLREPQLIPAWKSIIRDWKRIKQWRAFIQSNAGENSRKIYGFFKL